MTSVKTWALDWSWMTKTIPSWVEVGQMRTKNTKMTSSLPDTCQPWTKMTMSSEEFHQGKKIRETEFLLFWRIFFRSGRWSSFSWSSLYERTTDSSLSWADDELEKETTDKVKALFEKIDHCLYQDGPNENGDDDIDEDERPRTSDSFGSVNPCLSEEMKGECAIWRQRFPHLR